MTILQACPGEPPHPQSGSPLSPQLDPSRPRPAEAATPGCDLRTLTEEGGSGTGVPGTPDSVDSGFSAKPWASVGFTSPSAAPPTPPLRARVLQTWGSAGLLPRVGWGRLGGPGVMGCVVTQPPTLVFLCGEKERGGGYLSDRILPFLRVRNPCFASPRGRENYVCAWVSLESGFPSSSHPNSKRGEPPPQLFLLVFLHIFLAQRSLGRRIWGHSQGIPSVLSCTRSINACVLGLLWLAGWDVPPIFILMIQGGRWAGSKKTAHVPFSLVVCLIFLNQLKLWNLHVCLFYPFHLFQRHPPFLPPKRSSKELEGLSHSRLKSFCFWEAFWGQCWDTLGSP